MIQGPALCHYNALSMFFTNKFKKLQSYEKQMNSPKHAVLTFEPLLLLLMSHFEEEVRLSFDDKHHGDQKQDFQD